MCLFFNFTCASTRTHTASRIYLALLQRQQISSILRMVGSLCLLYLLWLFISLSLFACRLLQLMREYYFGTAIIEERLFNYIFLPLGAWRSFCISPRGPSGDNCSNGWLGGEGGGGYLIFSLSNICWWSSWCCFVCGGRIGKEENSSRAKMVISVCKIFGGVFGR